MMTNKTSIGAGSESPPRACSGASVDERLDALHSLTRRALDRGTPGGLYAATAYHLAARAVRQNAHADGSAAADTLGGVVGNSESEVTHGKG
jgi:hypothetical protein